MLVVPHFMDGYCIFDPLYSFFPSTIKSWNKLSPQLRNAPTLNRFKQANKNHTIKPLKFYIAGCRILNIIHTRLRHRSSSLNADLFRVHLANDPGCICGCAFEDAILGCANLIHFPLV
jgi:hypothetical protein